MQNLKIENTTNAPDIFFDYANNILDIRGESYPENAREFFGPVVSWLKEYIQDTTRSDITMNIELVYFNSSTSKVLMNIFDMFEEAAGEGKIITVNWIYDPRNENAIEYGEDFREDLENVQFHLIPSK